MLNKSMTKTGFTLIELLITISIIAILTTIGIVTYQQVLKNGRDAKRQSDLKGIQSVLEQYRVDQGFYPNNTNSSFDSALTAGSSFTNQVGNPNTPASAKPYMKNLPLDFTGSPRYLYAPLPALCDNSALNTCTDYCLYASVENSVNSKDTACANDATRTLEMTKP